MDSQRKDERGYAMAVLLVGIAVLMVFLGAAMPVWNQQAKREREEELLFRLKQYAHAIALYQRRLPGAQPPSIDALVEQRFLRRKYKDPMTGGDFAVLRVGQVSPGMTAPLPGMTLPGPGGAQGPGVPAGVGQPSAGGRQSSPGPGGPSGARQLGGQSGQPLGGGAIRGVVSTSTESSLRIWKGRTRYDQWEVTPEDIVPRFMPVQGNPNQPGSGGPGQPTPGGPGSRPPGPGMLGPGLSGPGGARPGGVRPGG